MIAVILILITYIHKSILIGLNNRIISITYKLNTLLIEYTNNRESLNSIPLFSIIKNIYNKRFYIVLSVGLVFIPISRHIISVLGLNSITFGYNIRIIVYILAFLLLVYGFLIGFINKHNVTYSVIFKILSLTVTIGLCIILNKEIIDLMIVIHNLSDIFLFIIPGAIMIENLTPPTSGGPSAGGGGSGGQGPGSNQPVVGDTDSHSRNRRSIATHPIAPSSVESVIQPTGIPVPQPSHFILEQPLTSQEWTELSRKLGDGISSVFINRMSNILPRANDMSLKAIKYKDIESLVDLSPKEVIALKTYLQHSSYGINPTIRHYYTRGTHLKNYPLWSKTFMWSRLINIANHK